MAFTKYIPVLFIVGLLCTGITGSRYSLKTPAYNEDSTLPLRRTKRSMTTICVEIKPTGPQEEPYYMCKGTELPTIPSVTSSSYRPTTPIYAAADSQFQAPSAAYNMKDPVAKMDAYVQPKTTTTSSNITPGSNQHIPGYGGFRGSTATTAFHRPTNEHSAVDNKQQFFPQPFHAQPQQLKHEHQQQPQQQNQKSSQTQPVASYGLSTVNNNSQQPASFAPSSALYASKSGTAQTQPAYFESSAGGASYGGPQPTIASTSAGAAAYGSAAKSHGTNRPSGSSGSSGSHGQSAFAEPLPVAGPAQASYGPTIPYAHAAVSAPVEAKHGFAQATPVAGLVVPAVKAAQSTNIKTNMEQPTYGFSDQSHSNQFSFDTKPHSYQQPNTAPVQYQSNAAALSYPTTSSQPATFATKNPKTEVPSLADYRSMLDDDIFRSPIWGFSPDEFSHFRSLSEVAVPRQNIHQPVLDFAAAGLQQPHGKPADYFDDPVMRQFYSSLHEPNFEDQLVGAHYAQPAAYKPQAPKAPEVIKRHQETVAAAAPFYDAPTTRQPAPVVYSQPICSAPAPPPPLRQQLLQQCTADSMTGASYQPPLPLAMTMPCAACNRADYNNFQPVFIALPCYGQPNSFGNLNAGGAAFFNLGMHSSQPSYPNMLNAYQLDSQRAGGTQYDREVPGLFSGFEAAANPFAGARTAFPFFGMPYAAPTLGTNNPFGFYNRPQHQMAQVANVERVSPPMSSHTNTDMEGDQFLGSVQTSDGNNKELADDKVSTIAADSVAADAAVATTLTTEATPIVTANTAPKATTAGIETKSTTNGRINARTDRLVGAEAAPSTDMGAGSTSPAASMGEEKNTNFKQLITLAKAAKDINKDEFPDPSEIQTQAQPVKNDATVEQRKGKRQNMRMQGGPGALYMRQQYVQNAQ